MYGGFETIISNLSFLSIFSNKSDCIICILFCGRIWKSAPTTFIQFFSATSIAFLLMSDNVISELEIFFAIAIPIAPLPVHKSIIFIFLYGSGWNPTPTYVNYFFH